jgi:DNA-binding response OmpR family regulator
MGLDVIRSPDALHALLGAHRMQPDLVLTDVNLPNGNGLSLCEFLRCDEKLAHVPVIIMSGQSNDQIVQRCRALGAPFVKKGPQLWETLEPLITELLNPTDSAVPTLPTGAPEEARPDRPRILSIDDDPDVSRIIQMRLLPYGVDVQRAFKGMQGFWWSVDMRPDVIITDMEMPDGEGNYILSRIRSHSITKDTPVIVLTGKRDIAIKRAMLNLGASSYLTKPIDFAELFAELRQHIPLVAQPVSAKAVPHVATDPCR